MNQGSMIILFAIVCSGVGILYAIYLALFVRGQDSGTPEMQKIQQAIQEGSEAYMRRQFKAISVVAATLFVLLWVAGFWSPHFGLLTASGFLLGGLASALSGYVGMAVSVNANAKVAQMARQGLGPALNLAFRGGAVTGLLLISLG
ncbi:MAG: sodium/proton-translocating pyrophosphatase, partial [Nitrospirae bacterium]|nr:sodium/proton-translocating pyrophosphatase [Candidatus Troglogloeales bacterium]